VVDEADAASVVERATGTMSLSVSTTPKFTSRHLDLDLESSALHGGCVRVDEASHRGRSLAVIALCELAGVIPRLPDCLRCQLQWFIVRAS
jgi:hypothetical protein